MSLTDRGLQAPTPREWIVGPDGERVSVTTEVIPQPERALPSRSAGEEEVQTSKE